MPRGRLIPSSRNHRGRGRGVILVGTDPFASLTRVDDQYTYFMGASRAKQLLGVVEG